MWSQAMSLSLLLCSCHGLLQNMYHYAAISALKVTCFQGCSHVRFSNFRQISQPDVVQLLLSF